MAAAKLSLDFGNVSLSGDGLDLWYGTLGGLAPTLPAFANVRYEYDSADNRFYRVYCKPVIMPGGTVWVERSRVPLVLSFQNKWYELFAFAASSRVAAVGGVNSMAGLGGVFHVRSSMNLRKILRPDRARPWNTNNTGRCRWLTVRRRCQRRGSVVNGAVPSSTARPC